MTAIQHPPDNPMKGAGTMEINVNRNHLKTRETGKAGKSRTSPGKAMAGKFDEILKETVRKIDRSPEEQATLMVDRLAFNTISPIGLHPIDSSRTPTIVKNVEGFLDALEDYQRNLENRTVDMRDIGPLVDKLHRERERLAPMLDSMPEDDELKDILNRTLVTASLEITRFSRGDYAPI